MIIGYLLIIFGIMIWGVLIPAKKQINPRVMEYTTTFGGAFLFAVCFLQLLPHLFEPHIHHADHLCTHAHDHSFISMLKPGIWVLVGFLIQLLLETLTRGIEHGHNHAKCCSHSHSEAHVHPISGLLIGLSLHSFMEGMPLTFGNGQVHWGLLYGILLHNIPITLILITLFINNKYSTLKSLALLLLFAVMTPLGS
ncbi:MAG: ZIP family metal transporter, partial [Bacteroidales bacterium]|nr:ZIP family metal transporter [Bacteroidales bacterium]